jgi:hypothetical protein
MRRKVSFIILSALVVLSAGGTCRTETAQSVLSSFLTEIAVTTGQAVGELLTGTATP